MRKNSKLKIVLKKLFLSVLVMVLILILPSVQIFNDDNFERIYKAFLGNKTNFQGVIEVWNIDSFESGSESKTKMLNKIASKFQKSNKGVYVMVRNISEQECLNLLTSGQCPDLFSCSFGVSEKLKNYVQCFDSVDCDNIDESAKIAGIVNDLQMGAAWCKGSYCLVSTSEKLEKAKIENFEKVKLSDIFLSTGYVVQGKNSNKMIYSLSIGNSKYLMPQEVIRAYNKAEVNLISDNSLNKDKINQSQYSAYCNFISGECNILLGSQRDVYRLENRINLGKIDGVVYEQITHFTDLIQFMLLSKNVQKEKKMYAEKFVNFLLLNESQQIVCDGGMFSIIRGFECKNKGVMRNITLNNFSNYNTFNIFVSESEIKKLQQI